jgi:formylglycine-generating enzyme required for sulfatase activity
MLVAMRTPYGDFVEIPRGEFMMGNDTPYLSLNGEIRKEHTHARQVHRVKVTKRLAFLETPLSCELMARFLDCHPGAIADGRFRFKVYDDPGMAYALGDVIEHPPTQFWDESTHSYWLDPSNAALPATGLSWEDARLFCEAVSGVLSMRVRLPSEAEWEYACRAGATTVFHFGTDTASAPSHAWCCVNSGLEPKPSKHFAPNAWGLYDTVGNVWEWCQDKYSTAYYAVSPTEDPLCEEQTIVERVIRGGSSMNKAETCRSSHRYGLKPCVRDRFLGFRPIIEIP